MVCHFASKVNSVIFQADNFDAPSSHLCCGQPFAVLMLFPLYSDHYFFVFCFWSSRNLIHTHTHTSSGTSSKVYRFFIISSEAVDFVAKMFDKHVTWVWISDAFERTHKSYHYAQMCLGISFSPTFDHNFTSSFIFFSSFPNANAYFQPNRTHRYWTNR